MSIYGYHQLHCRNIYLYFLCSVCTFNSRQSRLVWTSHQLPNSAFHTTTNFGRIIICLRTSQFACVLSSYFDIFAFVSQRNIVAPVVRDTLLWSISPITWISTSSYVCKKTILLLRKKHSQTQGKNYNDNLVGCHVSLKKKKHTGMLNLEMELTSVLKLIRKQKRCIIAGVSRNCTCTPK